MNQSVFHTYASHNDVVCFDCSAHIGGKDKPLFYGFPKGAYGVYCADCHMRTYYDTDDKSIAFDRIGNPIEPSCSCGCTIPKDKWDTSSGWARCPDCQYI
jgi:hypothetical protein